MDTKLLSDVVEDIENKYKDKPYLETGFFDLDDLLCLRKKDALITIGARPAMGKTAFMYNIMVNLASQGKKCLLFSLDMSAEQSATRLIFQHSECDSIKARTGRLDEKDWEKIADTLNFLAEAPIIIEDNTTLTIDEIEEKIKKEKPEFVFIDYLQIVNLPKKCDRYYQIEYVMRNLKRIAKENEAIIFVTSQLTRAVETRCDKRPMLSDLRDSGSIEYISDIVLFIYRHAYYNHYSEEEYEYRDRNEAEIIVAKNKFGPVGTITLKFAPNLTKFSNYTKITEVF